MEEPAWTEQGPTAFARGWLPRTNWARAKRMPSTGFVDQARKQFVTRWPSVGAEGDGAARIQIDEQRSLRLIPAYKHLGAFLASTGALQSEITKRCTSGKVDASLFYF